MSFDYDKLLKGTRLYLIGCRIYQSTAQTIPDSTWTKIEFQSINYDRRNEVDLSNNRVTVKNDGIYFLKGSVEMDSSITDGTKLMVAIYRNGNAFVSKYAHTGLSDFIATGPADIRKLASGDDITLQVWHNSGGSVDTISLARTTFLTVSQIA